MLESIAMTIAGIGGLVLGFISKYLADKTLDSDCRLRIGKRRKERSEDNRQDNQ